MSKTSSNVQGCTGSVLRVGTVQVATKHGSVLAPAESQKAGRKVNINTQPWSTMCWNAKDMKGHSNITVWRTINTNHYIIILSTWLFSSLKFYVQLSVQGDKSESISWQTCIHLSSHPPRWETVGLVSAWYNDGSHDRQESTNQKFLAWHRFAFSSFIAGPQNHQLQCNWICLMSWFVFLQTIKNNGQRKWHLGRTH